MRLSAPTDNKAARPQKQEASCSRRSTGCQLALSGGTMSALAMDQPTLFDAVPTKSAERLAFEAFDAANPQIWRLFERFAIEVIESGRTRFSARAIFHRIRWSVMIETKGDDFKINNNFSPFYSRMWAKHHPEYATLFAHRASVADD